MYDRPYRRAEIPLPTLSLDKTGAAAKILTNSASTRLPCKSAFEVIVSFFYIASDGHKAFEEITYEKVSS